MGLEKNLHDLLYCHDCVIVPHWGGFLTHYRSARIDEARRVIHPPGKDLSFNKNLDRNDGLLADHISRREGKGFKDAQHQIEATVKEWRRTLDHHGRLELPHIGIFYRDAEKNLQFDPDRQGNFLKEAYGLRPLSAIPVEMPAPRVIKLPVSDPSDASLTDRPARIIWAAAATAAVLFGAAAIWAYRAGTTEKVQWSGLYPFDPPVERTYVPVNATPEEITTAASFTLPADTVGIRSLAMDGMGIALNVRLGAEILPAKKPGEITPVRKEVTGVPANGRYHVIGGCFAQEENAEKFMAELESNGFQARKLPRYKDLHPVAFGSFGRREDALQALAQVKAGGKYSAWLLVR